MSFAAGYLTHRGLSSGNAAVRFDHPVYEIFPGEDVFPERRAPDGHITRELPKVAIIIDDMGYNRELADTFLELDAVITYSVLPNSPHKKETIGKIREKGMEIMLHLPMEPSEYPTVNPGPETLLSSMPPDELRRQLAANLAGMPFIKGVNNHMGSRITAIPNQMYLILSVLKQERLFFVDSFTTPRSVCRSAARSLGVPFARRDVFLDHVLDPVSVANQLRRLVEIAEAYGEAVGIGHPYPLTCEILRNALPEFKKRVRLVPASDIVHTIG